ncbi:MAG: hypothetical protein IV100_06535 [Myxococcales bacterium]|nr:hypothetical protein [Myxococcales bacterium]
MTHQLYALILLSTSLALSAGCKSEPRGCDDKQLDKVIDALKSIDAEQRGILSAMGIAESCTSSEKPMPASLKTALSSLGQVAPESQMMVAMKAVAGDPILWSLACRGGVATAQALAQLPDAERGSLLAKECLQPDASISESALRSASTPLAIVGLMTDVWLRTQGTDAKRAKKLMSAMLP